MDSRFSQDAYEHNFDQKHSSLSAQEVHIAMQPMGSRTQDATSQLESGSRPRPGQGVTSVLHGGRHHTNTGSPADCLKCGEVLADILCNQLQVGNQTNARFQFRDVMILSRDTKISYDSKLIKGLRRARIPVHISGKDDSGMPPASIAPNELLVVREDHLLIHPEASRAVMVVLQSTPSSSLSVDSEDLVTKADHVIRVLPRYADDDSSDEDIDEVIDDVINTVGDGSGQDPTESDGKTRSGRARSGGDDAGGCDGCPDCCEECCEGIGRLLCCPEGCCEEGAWSTCWGLSCLGSCCSDSGDDNGRSGRGGSDCDCDDCVIM